MPELPEVEFCRRTLRRWTRGRRIVDVVVRDPRSIRRRREDRPTHGDPEGEARLREVVSAAPGDPIRHGKRILWPFGRRALLLHLGMTGKWSRGPEPRHPRVGLVLDDAVTLWLGDPRLLAGIVPTTLREGRDLLVAGLGPDALRDPFPRLTGTRAVKVALLDQSVVAGLGNLHAAEALWRAGIHPARRCVDLTDEDHERLAAGVREQLETTLASFGHGDVLRYVEEPGAPNPFPLYQRGGEPCPRCGTPIAKMTQAARTTWWCPGCQR
jgi:formamidopyrimidine-DNA glycosylase